MTCAEVYKMADKHPLACTRAERMAFAKHCLNCPDCRMQIEAGEKEDTEINGPLPDDESQKIDETLGDDMLDPEAGF